MSGPTTPQTQRLVALTLLLGTMAFMAFNAVIGIVVRDLGVPEWQIGLVVTASGLAVMATGRYWGRQSDAKGRLAILRRGLAGNCAGFFALATFIAWCWSQRPSPFVVFVGLLAIRIATTLYYAAVHPAAQAFVADITTALERPRGMALLGLGSAVGMVAGPAMASALAPLSVSLPLWGSAATALAALLLAFRLPPHVPAKRDVEPPPLSFRDPRLRFPQLAALSAMLCVMGPQVVSGFFAQDRFSLPTPEAAALAGWALTSVGVALVCASLAVRRSGWPPRRLVLFGAPVACVGFFGTALVAAPWQMVLASFIAGFGMGFIFPAFQAEASMSVSDAEQGAALGAIAVAQALGMTVGPLIATLLYREVGPAAPYLFSAALLLAVWSMAAAMAQDVGPARSRAAAE